MFCGTGVLPPHGTFVSRDLMPRGTQTPDGAAGRSRAKGQDSGASSGTSHTGPGVQEYLYMYD